MSFAKSIRETLLKNSKFEILFENTFKSNNNHNNKIIMHTQNRVWISVNRNT